MYPYRKIPSISNYFHDHQRRRADRPESHGHNARRDHGWRDIYGDELTSRLRGPDSSRPAGCSGLP